MAPSNASTSADPFARQGFWGPVTATLDWCEENYKFSHYICEVANTFSNVFTIWIALHGARKTLEQSLPKRFLVGWLGFALVGIGSFAFHATLLYEAQLADELPMIFVASYSAFILYNTETGFGHRNLRSYFLALAVAAFDILFTWSYATWYRNPMYHQIVFALLVIATSSRVTYLIRWSPASMRVPDKTRSSILQMFWTGAGLFALGFGIWNMDNALCGTLTRWKASIGWPAALLLEGNERNFLPFTRHAEPQAGHSWWHVFTAWGTYLMISGVICETVCVKDDPRRYRLGGSSGLPHVEIVKLTKTQ
ncbi:phytoceramidase [Punctularia strigosozonata HHB-11173 SS5]|uniref:phytoceramidase n=1 Tax=Punctularia strigosozonata (strain HHB-11173) TaxID=741275 RepID=UPI00044168BE|nr:phytoceramidase [Punctularia strigosozonata HHB-11173 SS5]EIN13922.1 phytoceramidase [Punctularia strigosozonata HHB-11173 SS5]